MREVASDTTPIRAHTFLRSYSSASKPVLLRCDDSHEYVVKGKQAGRMIYNDQVLGRLAGEFTAPVPPVRLVFVPRDLIDAEPRMSYIEDGVSHGSRFLANATERAALDHTDLPENQQRFADLAALYGWAHAGDHQFIYANSKPNLVYSVDHGHFFPNGPDWTVSSLGKANPAVPDASIVAVCQIEKENWVSTADRLEAFGDELIDHYVNLPPKEWKVTGAERRALATYLKTRRTDIVRALRSS